MDVVCGKSKAAASSTTSLAGISRRAEYIKGTRITVAFVSTNSITQGEQVPASFGASSWIATG